MPVSIRAGKGLSGVIFRALGGGVGHRGVFPRHRTELLAMVFASDLFSQEEFPKPSNAERKPSNAERQPSNAERQPSRNVVMDEDQPRLLGE